MINICTVCKYQLIYKSKTTICCQVIVLSEINLVKYCLPTVDSCDFSRTIKTIINTMISVVINAIYK